MFKKGIKSSTWIVSGIVLGALLTCQVFAQAPGWSCRFPNSYIVSSLDTLQFPIIQGNELSIDSAYAIAIKKAESVYGKVQPGPIIYYSCLDGKVAGYQFCFRRGKQSFPSQVEIHREIENNPKWFSNYCQVFVSNTQDSYRIPFLGEGLPPFYTYAMKAKNMLMSQIGEELRLNRIYIYGTPLDLIFEFVNGDTFRINPFKKKIFTSEEFQRLKEAIRYQDRQKNLNDGKKQQGNSSSILTSSSDHYIPDFYELECLSWSYGCSPTSASMVLSYYDNRYRNVGLLVGWYFERYDPVAKEQHYHVADIQKWLAICMGTDTLYEGGTNLDDVPLGIILYTNELGYIFDSENILGYEDNNYAWDWVKYEIDEGRPFVWSVAATEGHSTAAFGYSDDGYVLLYDTWNQGVQRWYYCMFSNQEWADYTAVTRVWGGAEDAKEVKLTFPDGGQGWGTNNGKGEVLYVGKRYTIRWDRIGGSGGYVDLWYSIDGGNNWRVITKYADNSGYYNWVIPNTPSTHCRVLINLFNNNGDRIGQDGSYGNFTIKAGPGIKEPLTKELNKFPTLNFAKNPVRGNIAFTYARLPENTVLHIFNAVGREVKSIPLFGNGLLILPVSDLSSGIYFYKLEGKRVSKSGKIVLLK